MLRLRSDEDFPGPVVNALRQRIPGLDLVRAQDVGLKQTPDPLVLEWAANQNRIVLSRDRSTLSVHAWNRVSQVLFMPGVILLRRNIPNTRACNELELVILASEHDEYVNRVEYVPL